MALDEQDKRKVEEEAEEKKKELPWWKNLSPVVLGAAGLVGFILIRGLAADETSKNNMLWLIGLVVVLYLISQTSRTIEDRLITPREAEILAGRAMDIKKGWGQFGLMCTYDVGPVSDFMHRDGRGIFYNVAVRLNDPYGIPKNYCAKVYAKGDSKGFVTIADSIAPVSGREIESEKSIVPGWILASQKYPIIEKLMLRERR